MLLAIQLGFLPTQAVVNFLRRSWCSTLRPVTVKVGAAFDGKRGSIIVKLPSIIVSRRSA